MTRKARVMVSTLTYGAILLLVAGLAGCNTPSKKPISSPNSEATVTDQGAKETGAAVSNSPLADTEWSLLEIQSMDDAIGTTRPDDSSKYTMRLNGHGTVTMHLNCNLANGTWSTEPSADRSSGRFGFGPLAGTRALCPPPSLDERVVADAKFVQSYLLKNGRLYLSLMADGGIYAWEPHPAVPYLTEPDKGLEAAIRKASPDYTKAIVDFEGSVGRGRYVYGRVDLNSDGRDEVFVYLLGSIFCGTGGCNLLLFTETQQGFSLINEFTTARLPVIVSAKKTKGWKNIAWLKSGGGVPSSYLNHTFNGKRYIEGKRMPADKVPEGKSYLVGELVFNKGIPLEPQD